MLIATKYDTFFAHAQLLSAQKMSDWNSRAHYAAFRTQDSRGSCQTHPLRVPVLHRVILKSNSAPEDITVDKGTPPTSEKAQQNQHFKYHRTVRYSYRDVNRPLIPPSASQFVAPGRAAPNVTPLWNMHRSGAACSLNVTSIGICLSSQQYVVTAISHFSLRNVLPPLTHPECGTIVKRTFGMLAGPRAKGFSRGIHESA